MPHTEPAPGPVACTLRPLEMASRRRLWDQIASEALIGTQATASGARLRFRASPGVEERLRELAELEKECCSFAAFSVERVDDAVLLEVESRGEGVEAVRRMFAAC